MIGDAASHGWCLFLLSRCASLTQFLVGAAEIVDRADQVHACFQRIDAIVHRHSALSDLARCRNTPGSGNIGTTVPSALL